MNFTKVMEFMSVSPEKRVIDFSIQIGEFVKFLREDGKGFREAAR